MSVRYVFIVLVLLAPSAHAQFFSDDFDGYASGSTIGGQGSWVTWDQSTDPLVDAPVSSAFAHTGSNSLFIGGTSDIVTTFTSIVSGTWIVRGWIYVESTQSGNAYWIMLNEYNALGPYNWSAQLSFNAATGLVSDLGGSAGGPVAGATLPLITDQWVEIEVLIDLDNNLHTIRYDGQTLRECDLWSGGLTAFQCLDLYSDSSSGVYYDTITIEELPCGALQGLTCTSDCTTGNVDLSWTLGSGTYDAIAVEIDGSVVATLGSTATSYTATGLVDGSHGIRVIGECGGSGFPLCCSVSVSSSVPDNIVWAAESAAQVDSVGAIETALSGAGLGSTTVAELDEIPCYQAGTHLFCMLGTFPSNHVLTEPEALALIDLLTAGVHVHIEGADIWGFDPVTSFSQYDGVADGAIDGNDTLVGLVGSDYATAAMSGLDAPYFQDQGTSDFTDQLTPGTLDLPGPDAGVIWVDDMTGGGTGYTVGIFYDTDPPFGKVISQSFEFGGYGGDANALLAAELAAFGAGPVLDEFRRGDANGDSTFDISDAVFLLGALFIPGSTLPACRDAADINDDGGLDISDAVFGLGALFVPGAPTPPAPGPINCGADPTADGLDCATYTCP
ncbi:MAG: hypothetical protein KDC38_16085 [Planctomycetes bacterium]|nr:hypothetical protein [Planctomycetota bacterium]